jgi:sugar lactone lactonase YvrE
MKRLYSTSSGLILGLTFASCQPQEPQNAEAVDAVTMPVPAFTLESLWELNEGIHRPESVVYDAGTNALYVSNMVGDARAKNGAGHIAKVGTDGSLVDSAWAVGLNAPKGVDVGNGKLYAADIDVLVEIDLTTAEITGRYPAAGATFLNDVAVGPDGAVFVSDSEQSAVWRLSDGTFEKWIEGDSIRSPNGLLAEADRLLIAANGTTVENPGSARYLMAISYADRSVVPLRDEQGIGGLDAIESDGQGGYILSDWGAGKIFHYTMAGGASEVLTVSQGTADLDYVASQRTVYLPVMMSDRVIAYRVP